jgi:hypothetical protein
MKLRGESGSVPFRGGMAGGTRTSSVGRDAGGRSGGASNLANAIQKRSVKVVPADKLKGVSKNIKSNEAAQNAKSGTTAKRGALDVKQSKPAKVTKVNSAPAKSEKTKTAAKVEAKALKAANKKLPNKNY